MNEVLIAIIIQVLLTMLFIWFVTKRNKKYIYLLFYLIAICLDFSFELILYNAQSRDLDFMLGIPTSFRLLKGPLLLMFTFKCLGKKVTPNFTLFLLTPFFLFFILNAIIYYGIIINDSPDQRLIGFYQRVFRFYIFYWVGYIVLSMGLIFNGKKPLSGETKRFLVFLFFLFVTVAGTWSLVRLFEIPGPRFWSFYIYIFFIQFALVYWLRLHTYIKNEKRPASERYKGSRLRHSDYQRILEKLTHSLKEKKLYLKEDLTLDESAREINVSRHHLTESLSAGLNSNFYEFVNLFRVDEAAILMNEEPELSISEVFYQSGFKSKATFYKYFRKKFGISPSEYRQSKINLSSS